MAFVPTEHCARIVLKYLRSTQSFSNVLHVVKSNFVTQDMQDLADDLDAIHVTGWKPAWPAQCFYNGVDIYDIRTSGGEVVNAIANQGVATGGGESAPINSAIVVTLRTAFRGRAGRGRMYIGGQSGTLFDGLGWEATATGNVLAWVSDIEDAIVAAGWTWVLRSTQVDGVALNPAATRPITSYEIRSSLPGSQRRRVDRP